MKSDRIFPALDWFPRPVGSVQLGYVLADPWRHQDIGEGPETQRRHDMLRERVRAFIDNQEGENERIIREQLMLAGWTPPPNSDIGIPISAHKLNADQTVAVATDVFWNEDMSTCPRGAKCQLLGSGGVAVYREYHGDPFWVGWAPVPKRRRKV